MYELDLCRTKHLDLSYNLYIFLDLENDFSAFHVRTYMLCSKEADRPAGILSMEAVSQNHPTQSYYLIDLLANCQLNL